MDLYGTQIQAVSDLQNKNQFLAEKIEQLAKNIKELNEAKPKPINSPMNAVNTAQIFYVMRSLLPILRYFFNL
jgi:hypothetical protein